MLAMATDWEAFQLRAETLTRSVKIDEAGSTDRCSSTETVPVLPSRFRTFRTVFLKR